MPNTILSWERLPWTKAKERIQVRITQYLEGDRLHFNRKEVALVFLHFRVKQNSSQDVAMVKSVRKKKIRQLDIAKIATVQCCHEWAV